MKRARILAAAMLAVVMTSESPAQDSARAEFSRWIRPGSDEENYVRALQTLGMVPKYPWSARSFSSGELRRLTPDSVAHPSAASPALRSRSASRGRVRIDIASIEGRTWYNTSLPYGMNDGAVWVGRGLTVAGSAGVSAAWGPVELTLAPEIFWAENRAFTLLPTGDASRPFADPLWPTDVDRPQRFGNGNYSRVDAGRSGIRVEVGGIATGITNAHESWGPMTDFPLILGTNAAGFPHAFVGTSRPLAVWIGRVHGRVIYARLEQSAFSPVTTLNPSRFASGMVAVFEPRFVPGLELGASRFFHVVWPDSGLEQRYFTHILQSFLKQRVGTVFAPFPGDPNSSTDNQLASVFARWVAPGSGFELYGEFGREDHNRDPRDLVLEPEQNGAYGVGMRKAWRREETLWLARAEVVNFQSSIVARHRGQFGWYRHTFTEQGHTSQGQLLAAGFAVGSGSGVTARLGRVRPSESWGWGWSRLLVRDPSGSDAPAVQHVFDVERSVQLNRHVGVHATLTVLREVSGGPTGDRGNVRLQVGSALRP